jgi:hypothetical protein
MARIYGIRFRPGCVNGNWGVLRIFQQEESDQRRIFNGWEADVCVSRYAFLNLQVSELMRKINSYHISCYLTENIFTIHITSFYDFFALVQLHQCNHIAW